jgi:hypothetical protein
MFEKESLCGGGRGFWWWMIDVEDDPIKRNRAIAIRDRIELSQLSLARSCNQSGSTSTRQFRDLSDSKDSLEVAQLIPSEMVR